MDIKTHFAIALILMIIFAGVDVGLEPDAEAKVAKPPKVETQVVKLEAKEETKPKVEKVKTQEEQIEEYILEKFGEKDGRRGIKMLRECENRDFGLTQINWNKNGTWDYGLWQINQIHGYTQKQLSDWKLNTDVAYKIYLKAGKSFSPWSCAWVIGEKPFWK